MNIYIQNLFIILRNEYIFIYELYFYILIDINILNAEMNLYLFLALYYIMQFITVFFRAKQVIINKLKYVINLVNFFLKQRVLQ